MRDKNSFKVYFSFAGVLSSLTLSAFPGSALADPVSDARSSLAKAAFEFRQQEFFPLVLSTYCPELYSGYHGQYPVAIKAGRPKRRGPIEAVPMDREFYTELLEEFKKNPDEVEQARINALLFVEKRPRLVGALRKQLLEDPDGALSGVTNEEIIEKADADFLAQFAAQVSAQIDSKKIDGLERQLDGALRGCENNLKIRELMDGYDSVTGSKVMQFLGRYRLALKERAQTFEDEAHQVPAEQRKRKSIIYRDGETLEQRFDSEKLKGTLFKDPVLMLNRVRSYLQIATAAEARREAAEKSLAETRAEFERISQQGEPPAEASSKAP